MSASIEERALRLEKERTANRVQDAIRNIRVELDRLERDPSEAGRARQVVGQAGDLAQAAARLETLMAYGNLVSAEVSTP